MNLILMSVVSLLFAKVPLFQENTFSVQTCATFKLFYNLKVIIQYWKEFVVVLNYKMLW